MRIIYSTCEADQAEALARTLVEERLAACVQILPGVRSLYRWEGEVQVTTESRLCIKTSTARVSETVARLRALHPYRVPEISVVEVDELASDPDYVDWVRTVTAPDEGEAAE